ncbi:hypothetical protein [Dankookia sp. GCM10030260]|uniref:hypothetical protein n=1 Tax=Dankookia sp. GCM10030260 TaxID=3273390 RepID=UPI0036D3B853
MFAALSVLGFANGITGRVQGSLLKEGLALALAGTFDTSAIVWVAFLACPVMFLRGPREAPRRLDLMVAAGVLASVMLPIAPLSWVALTALALYILLNPFAPDRARSRSAVPPSSAHRGAWILLAITGSMFWGRVLLFSASAPVLGADAQLVGWLAGVETAGNTVRFADGEGYVWIAPYCSSISNISLAVLCWVMFSQFRGLAWTLRTTAWCLLAALSVVVINVTRISLMVLHKEQFDLIHGPVGAAVASWLSVAAVLGICMWGTRRARAALA